MSHQITLYILCLVLFSACSYGYKSNVKHKNQTKKSTNIIKMDIFNKLDCNEIVLSKFKVRNSLLRYCKQQQNSCLSSEARSAALRRLWKIYGKKDIRTFYQVVSEGNVWVVKSSTKKAPSRIIHVVIPKNSKQCKIKEIFHKRSPYDVYSIMPMLKKASDYKCPSHIVGSETCKKLLYFQNKR